jgi:hypothetical protein
LRKSKFLKTNVVQHLRLFLRREESFKNYKKITMMIIVNFLTLNNDQITSRFKTKQLKRIRNSLQRTLWLKETNLRKLNTPCKQAWIMSDKLEVKDLLLHLSNSLDIFKWFIKSFTSNLSDIIHACLHGVFSFLKFVSLSHNVLCKLFLILLSCFVLNLDVIWSLFNVKKLTIIIIVIFL